MGKPFVAFCTSVQHAMNVAQGFRDEGIDAVCIHGGLNDEVRAQIVGDFRRGRITGLTSVDLISEGFDVPGIVCGLLLRPTASRGLFIQQFGRLLRLSPEKAFATILDHVGNCARHGLPTDLQQWSLEGTVKKGRAKKQEISIRICPKCYAANPAGSLICRECGHEWMIEPRLVDQVDGDLVEWVAEKRASVERIEEWRAKSLEDLQAIARKRGYKPGWAHVRFNARLKRVGAT
jgi:superfamily II DNA or RNA helicase